MDNNHCPKCGKMFWIDALPGSSLKFFCPICEQHDKTGTTSPRVIDWAQNPNSGITAPGDIPVVETVNDLPRTGPDLNVGLLRLVKDVQQIFVLGVDDWIQAGPAKTILDNKPRAKVDKVNNRRAAIAHTKAKKAARAAAAES